MSISLTGAILEKGIVPSLAIGPFNGIRSSIQKHFYADIKVLKRE